MAINTIAVVGPTASGKTGRAVSLARRFDGEVVSGDSRQVYRGMTLGTGKDLEEYGDVPYHLIDIADPGEKYNLYRFLSDYDRVSRDLEQRGRKCILCGGSGMYVENALRGLVMPEVPRNEALREQLATLTNEELKTRLEACKSLHNVTDLDTRQRMERALEISDYYRLHPEEALKTDTKYVRPRPSVIVGIDMPREERRKRITRRLYSRLEAGMLDEVRSLLQHGVSAESLIYYGLEYKYLTLHLIGQLYYDEMVRQLEIAIHQFAKRQMTWWRGMERRGLSIDWLSWEMTDGEFGEAVEEILRQKENTDHER